MVSAYWIKADPMVGKLTLSLQPLGSNSKKQPQWSEARLYSEAECEYSQSVTKDCYERSTSSGETTSFHEKITETYKKKLQILTTTMSVRTRGAPLT